jgi:hypothetical protein
MTGNTPKERNSGPWIITPALRSLSSSATMSWFHFPKEDLLSSKESFRECYKQLE